MIDHVNAYVSCPECTEDLFFDNGTREHEDAVDLPSVLFCKKCGQLQKATLEDTFLALKGINANTIRLFLDGNEWCALIGSNIMEGVVGFGNTRAEALRNLVLDLEKKTFEKK